jgi:hypothetical protein
MGSGCCPAGACGRRGFRPFERVFTDGSTEQRFIRETVYGKRQAVRSYQITTDPVTRPSETTWDLMTNLPGKIGPTVGNTFGLRTWVEYGLKHAQDDLGWADDRVTDYASIARWWELVMSADTLVSLQQLVGAAPSTAPAPTATAAAAPPPPAPTLLAAHPAWDGGTGWKHELNNLRLLLQPLVCTCLRLPWLHLLSPPHAQAVQTGLATLGSLVDTFRLIFPT